MSGVSRDPRTAELHRQLRLQLPRILVLLGIALLVVGVIATIAFVAGDSSCNAGSNLYSVNGGSYDGLRIGSDFCQHEGGFLTITFMTMVLGAILIGMGSMVIPTLRSRDARLAREKAAVDAAIAAAVAASEAEDEPETVDGPNESEAADS